MHREKEKTQRERESIACRGSLPDVASPGLGGSQESGSPFGSPICVSGCQAVYHFPSSLANSWFRSGASRTLYGTCSCDTGIAASSLSALVPAGLIFFFQMKYVKGKKSRCLSGLPNKAQRSKRKHRKKHSGN